MNDNKECGVCHRSFKTEQDYLKGTSRWRVCSEGNLWFNCSCGSTLMVKKGKFDWYSPERLLGAEARGVFNQLGGMKNLPHIPAEVLELQRMMQEPNVDAKDVAKELRKEPVLATEIMQLAENLRMARNPTTPKIKALEHAIVYVGFKALSDLLLTTALKVMRLPASEFDLDRYWEDAYVTGMIAEALMRRYAPGLNPDEVFLAGSLCNIGKLVMAFCQPGKTGLVDKDSSGVHEPLVTWRQSERLHGAPDHCILGEIASTLWGFPVLIMEVARKHHDTVLSIPVGKPLDLIELIAVANQMTHWVLLRPHRMEYDLINNFARRASLDQKGLDELARELTSLTAKAKALPH